MWLYIPNLPSETSYPCAQGLVGLSSESSLPLTTLERLDGVWFTWRGKPQQPQAWSRRWKQGGFIRRLSGLTCEPLMADRGAASFISSLRAIPARTIALPESAPDQTGHGSSPPKLSALPRSAGLILYSARTCRGTLADSSRPLSRHWSDWATALRQEYSVRPKPVIPCGARGCSSWPSPMAGSAGTEDYNPAGNSDFSRKAMELAEGVLTWAAPRTSDTNGAGQHGNGGLDLRTQAAKWMTPMTADTGQKVTHATKQYSLIQQAERDFCHPPSSPAPAIAGGANCSTNTPNTNQPSVKRKLNPFFVEALMRWPTGLSGFARPAMALIQWQQLMRSYLSTLCSTQIKAGEQRQIEMF